MGWGKILSEFALNQRAAGLSERTIQNRHELLSLLAKSSEKGPLEIEKRDLLLTLSRNNPRTGTPISSGTKQSNRSYFQTFFRWLKKEGYRDDDPAADLPKVKMPRRKPRPFRIEQVERMLDCGVYKRTRDMIIIGALSGLRLGEIVKIRGEDLDLESGILYAVRKGGIECSVALHPTLLDLAEEYPRNGWWFPSPTKNKLFPKGDGHILMKSASDRIGKAIRRSGIHDVRLTGHSLRHYYATTLLREGVDIRCVQEMMAHSSLSTTQMYLEVTDSQMVAAVEKIPSIAIRYNSGRLIRNRGGLGAIIAV